MSRQAVDEWLGTLAGLLNPAFPGDLSGAMKTLRPHIEDLPAVAFTPATARDCATAKRKGMCPGIDVILPVLRQAVLDATPRKFELAPPVVVHNAPPDAEAIARVEAKVAGMKRDMAASAIADAERMPPKSPLPDVSLKGEQLAEARRRAGNVVAA